MHVRLWTVPFNLHCHHKHWDSALASWATKSLLLTVVFKPTKTMRVKSPTCCPRRSLSKPPGEPIPTNVPFGYLGSGLGSGDVFSPMKWRNLPQKGTFIAKTLWKSPFLPMKSHDVILLSHFGSWTKKVFFHIFPTQPRSMGLEYLTTFTIKINHSCRYIYQSHGWYGQYSSSPTPVGLKLPLPDHQWCHFFCESFRRIGAEQLN